MGNLTLETRCSNDVRCQSTTASAINCGKPSLSWPQPLKLIKAYQSLSKLILGWDGKLNGDRRSSVEQMGCLNATTLLHPTGLAHLDMRTAPHPS